MSTMNGKTLRERISEEPFVDFGRGDDARMKTAINNFLISRGLQPSRQWGSKSQIKFANK